jgi:hypothetical protein
MCLPLKVCVLLVTLSIQRGHRNITQEYTFSQSWTIPVVFCIFIRGLVRSKSLFSRVSYE